LRKDPFGGEGLVERGSSTEVPGVLSHQIPSIVVIFNVECVAGDQVNPETEVQKKACVIYESSGLREIEDHLRRDCAISPGPSILAAVIATVRRKRTMGASPLTRLIPQRWTGSSLKVIQKDLVISEGGHSSRLRSGRLR
jgi:hypothetical protein